MSGTPGGLGAFNKDKVANKFGIQLKPKHGSNQSQSPLSPPSEKKSTTAGSSGVTKNKTISDFRTQDNTNGFSLNKNTTIRSNSSKTPEPTKKIAENTSTSKSNSGLVNTSVNNERPKSLTAHDNHSTEKSLTESSSSNVSLSSKSPATVKKSSLTPAEQSISPEPSSIKRTSVTKTTTERAVSPAPPVKRPSVSTPAAKTEAQMEHQKDQPLYKRQLSKTLDSTSSATNKTKHLNEQPTTTATTTSLKR